MERSKLQRSTVGTVADAVGPVMLLDIQIEGCPVKAVVDTGAQSTIISRDLVHQIAKVMREAGNKQPTLVRPSAKLYGRSGSDRSELTITAEVQLQLSLDDYQVRVPVFIEPGSDILCLIGMNWFAPKSEFLREEVPYLGHVVTREGIKPDRDYPAPNNVTQVRQFLGLASYYRRFMPDFAKIKSPLHLLLKRDAVFDWTSACESSFHCL